MDTPSENETPKPTWRRRLPRPETTLLLVALVGTLGAKLVILRTLAPDNLLFEMTKAAMSDLVFFSGAALLFSLAYTARQGAWIARLTLVVSAVVGFWSLINGAWLISTGVQIQPAVLQAVANEPTETWLIITETLMKTKHRVWPAGVVALVCGVWFAWRLIRTAPVTPGRRPHAVRAARVAIVLVLAAMGQAIDFGPGKVSTWGQAIGFSSHWYAIVQVTSDVTRSGREVGAGRVVPRAGERTIELPDVPGGDEPNVVVIFLESVSHKVTTLADPAIDTTPVLARLATEGVEFASTHADVPHTTKAFWAGLTGTHADIQNDAAESVLVDAPYESLASILGRSGYRSAFFEMARGPLEGAPGLFANLAFDWAWFRENLEDRSAFLGWANGDDFRLIEPMFEWVDRSDDPFLLTMITTVTHDPWELPAWYPHEKKDDPYERYLDAIRFDDEFVGAVLEELAKRGIDENTLVCVIGDHGEVFRPESKRGRWVAYEDAIRIPWVIRFPGRVPPGTRIEWPCHQVDVTPTILGMLGYGLDEAGFDGLDAMQPIPDDRRLYFQSWYRNSPEGYRERDRKLVYLPYTDTLFAYDLAADPDELSPALVEGAEKDEVIEAVRRWKESTFLEFPARRFRERMLFDHWRTMSSGRTTTAYYVHRESRDDG